MTKPDKLQIPEPHVIEEVEKERRRREEQRPTIQLPMPVPSYPSTPGPTKENSRVIVIEL